MKVVFICLFSICVILSAKNIEINDISEKIAKINSSVKKNQKLDYKVYDPFATAKPILKIKKIVKKSKIYHPITVEAILNNKAFIENKWYSVKDKIRGFKIISIKKDGIMIVKNNKKSLIKLRGVGNMIQIKELDK